MHDTVAVSFSAAFSPDTWVDEHADYLYRFASFRVHNPSIVQDLVQETFLAALKNYHAFEHGSGERTWLISILKNKIIDYYRSTTRRSEMTDDTLPGYYPQGLKKGHWQKESAPLAWPEDISKRYDQKEFVHFLRACLQKIPVRLANIFIMREIDGYSAKEICKEMELSSSNLWVMIHRARHLLRACLQKDGYGPDET